MADGESGRVAGNPRGWWMSRLRFVAGVLAVLAGLWLVRGVYGVLAYQDSAASRLRERQLCVVWDFASESIFAPTDCGVLSVESQRSPSGRASDSGQPAKVDLDTLVMVDHDAEKSAIEKGAPGRIDLDRRIVAIYFISGPLSGRLGWIERYKLRPLD